MPYAVPLEVPGHISQSIELDFRLMHDCDEDYTPTTEYLHLTLDSQLPTPNSQLPYFQSKLTLPLRVRAGNNK